MPLLFNKTQKSIPLVKEHSKKATKKILKVKERKLTSAKIKGIRVVVLIPLVLASLLVGVALRGKHEKNKFDIPRIPPRSPLPQIQQESKTDEFNKPKIPSQTRRIATVASSATPAAPIALKPQTITAPVKEDFGVSAQ